jgi:acyl-CoA reductase-like NAD-dependent aldehyde dehydrogenase
MAATGFQLLIGGERVDGDGGSYDIVNPATEAVVGQAPEASASQADDAAAAAAEAFPAWSRTKPEQRAALLNKAADLLRERMDELIPLVQAETGATLRLSQTMQVPTCIERFRRYAKGALEPTVTPLPPSEMPTTNLAPGGLMGAMAIRQPVGVVACITPYNFPIVNMAGKIGPALAMGNTVVVKPAPQDPLAVTVFGEILHDAGFPAGVVNIVTGSSPDTGQALVASKHVDMVSFTGSTPVGQAIGEVAGRGMKRLLLELGGKGAGIVFDDADLATAIGTISSVWAFHSGQICTAPTLLAGCTADNPAVQQEFFGPVVVVVPFDDEDEAVSIANGTEFGLYDYVFSADTTRCLRVAKQLRTGTVGLNTAQRNHEAPFGGFKMSGVGRDGGSWGLHAYSELQSIVWPG